MKFAFAVKLRTKTPIFTAPVGNARVWVHEMC